MARSLQDRLREVQERGRVEPASSLGDGVASSPRGEASRWPKTRLARAAHQRTDLLAMTTHESALSLKARLQALIDQQVRGRRNVGAEEGLRQIGLSEPLAEVAKLNLDRLGKW